MHGEWRHCVSYSSCTSHRSTPHNASGAVPTAPACLPALLPWPPTTRVRAAPSPPASLLCACRLDFDDDLPPLDVPALVERVGSLSMQLDRALQTARQGQLLRAGLQVPWAGWRGARSINDPPSLT